MMLSTNPTVEGPADMIALIQAWNNADPETRRLFAIRILATYGLRLEKEAADLRSYVQEVLTDWNREGDHEVTVEEFIVSSDIGTADFLPLILAVLDLPADPWPELQTYGDLERMIGKGRMREAKRRGLEIMGEKWAHDKLPLMDKLTASIHRDWLLEAKPKKAAREALR